MELSRSKFTYKYISKSIKKGVIEDINEVIPVLSGLTLLQIATVNNDKKLVNYLLRKGADINSKSKCWGKVFNIAVMTNNLTTIQSLISYGADVISNINHQIEISESGSFLEAVIKYYEEDHTSDPELLLSSLHSLSMLMHCYKLDFAIVPLNIAISLMNVEMVELLLKNNANPNADADIDKYRSPLIFAAIRGNVPIIKLLLAYGLDVNIRKKHLGESLLHIVVQMRNSEAVEFFLNHDMFDINMVTDCKDSALHYGIMNATDDNIIRQLLNAGIDINLKNTRGKTAFTSRLNNSGKVNDAITEHIAKCSAANFYVNQENLAVVNSEKFGALSIQCMSEIEKMKTTFVGKSNVTYHYVLYNKCVHKLALSLKYVSDSTILDLDIKSIFPLYAGMMTYRLKKALRRKKFLFNAIDSTNDIFQELQLPILFRL
ncbi:putative ankyrin repeat protein RF_0381 [Microplitis mediator]|uniref:putative ankyrin repeat protein RF_0381 n=1 Tax=Microplitis mediator TaxID=375433 RepID=UPI0025544554|nr:putative ankyrin repeat protein RF_0381 [Microplitis mediator]